MEKQYDMNVTNIDQAVAVLKSMEIDAQSTGASIQFKIDESIRMKVIKHLNKEKVVIYDIEEK